MSILGFVLLAGACIGNTALLVFSLNRWYGKPYPHKFLSVVRLLHGFLVPAVPIALWWAYGWDLSPVLSGTPRNWGQVLIASYVLLCCLISFLVIPAITVARHLRPKEVLLHNHTHTIDVAARLGYKPFGHGKYRLFAQLPGNNIFRVDFAERTLCLRQLPPAWDGLTILHLSDLHLCGTPDREFYREVMEGCRDWDPDILALTGDVVDSDKHHRWMLPLLNRLRWRIAGLAILGNHDTWYDPSLVRRRLRRVRMDVLGNSWKTISVRGQPMVVIGNEAPWIGSSPDLSACPEGIFRLCLSHTPDNMRWARQNRIDLVLAGHVHGGQIRFPVIGSVLVPSCYSRRYDGGTFVEGPTVMHVSRGLAGQHPVRYNCRPEVTKIILRRDAGTTASVSG
jgi:predicted MPP superfamily phosphohydrolase